MSLQSQATRPGGSRRNMTRRRRKSKAPWLALLLLAGGVVGLYFMFAGGEPGTATGGEDGDASASTGTPTGVTPVTQRNPRPNAAQGQTLASDNPGSSGAATPRPGTDEQRPRTPDLSAYNREPATPLIGEAKDQYELGVQKLDEGDLITGRALLSELLFRDGALPRHEAAAVRERLAAENERLVFSRERVPGDTITLGHTVQSGELLGSIANTYKTPYQFLERINNVTAERLPAGRTIKVLRGPIHARVDKSDYRMDLYVEDPDGLKIYLCSYQVGLGETDSTPIGNWRITLGSKVVNPAWTNPRTLEHYERDDPNNPIGNYWMALEGMDENTRDKQSYGIHATIDPDSIGQQASMGCIRMRDADIEEVFYMLYEVRSRVEIVP